jgi:hypothetical protein
MSFLRYRLFPSLLFIWVMTGCSAKKDDPSPLAGQSDLVEKVWTSNQVDFVLDGKTYSEKTPGATGNWLFRKDGTYRTTDEDGKTEQGTWELSGNRIKLRYEESTAVDYLTITRLEDRTLVLNLIENLDLTKKEEAYTPSELTYFTMANHYLDRLNLDISKNRKLAINATLVVK